MANDERSEGAFVRKLMFLCIDQNRHHLVEVYIGHRLAHLSGLLLHDQLCLQLMLEAHDHIHSVSVLLMVDKQVLRLALLSEAYYVAQDALVCHMDAVDLLVDLLALQLLSEIRLRRPGVHEDVWCLSRLHIELEEQELQFVLMGESTEDAEAFLCVEIAQLLRKFDAKSIEVHPRVHVHRLDDELLRQGWNVVSVPATLRKTHHLLAGL